MLMLMGFFQFVRYMNCFDKILDYSHTLEAWICKEVLWKPGYVKRCYSCFVPCQECVKIFIISNDKGKSFGPQLEHTSNNKISLKNSLYDVPISMSNPRNSPSLKSFSLSFQTQRISPEPKFVEANGAKQWLGNGLRDRGSRERERLARLIGGESDTWLLCNGIRSAALLADVRR